MMKKTEKTLSVIIALALLMLHSFSPVFAEETPGTGSEEIVQTIEKDTGSEQPAQPSASDPEAEAPADPEKDNPTVEKGNPPAAQEPSAPENLPVAEVPATGPPADAPLTESQSPGEDGSAVLNVLVPTTVSVTLDPFELNGRGQIYSDVYEIKNFGDNNVLLTFTDLQITFPDDKNFEALASPFDEKRVSKLKSIYMQLDFGRDDEPSAVLTDSDWEGEVTIPLSGDQSDPERTLVSLSFSGNINHLPKVPWRDGDVRINLTYTLTPIPPPVQNNLLLTEGDVPEGTVTPEAIATPPAINLPPEEPVDIGEEESPDVNLPEQQPEEEQDTDSANQTPEGDSDEEADVQTPVSPPDENP